MKRLLPLLLFMFIIPYYSSSGQSYYRQAGVRTGYRSGLFFQITSSGGNAEIGYQAMLGFNNNGIQVSGLRIIYETSISRISPDLYFAWGYGGHFGFIITDNIGFLGERYNFEYEKFCPVFGADGWVSAEYRFRDIPLIISINIKPYVELTIPAFVNLMPGDIGISVSYVF